MVVEYSTLHNVEIKEEKDKPELKDIKDWSKLVDALVVAKCDITRKIW